MEWRHQLVADRRLSNPLPINSYLRSCSCTLATTLDYLILVAARNLRISTIFIASTVLSISALVSPVLFGTFLNSLFQQLNRRVQTNLSPGHVHPHNPITTMPETAQKSPRTPVYFISHGGVSISPNISLVPDAEMIRALIYSVAESHV